jgi:hypothetical protein
MHQIDIECRDRRKQHGHKYQQQHCDIQQASEQQKQEEQKQEEQKQEEQPAAEQDVSKGEPKMDKQETARLLQMVRDKEKQRNADRKAKVTRIQSAPAGKDW